MGVPQYTTPTFTLTFSESELDLTQATHVYVTFGKGREAVTKSDDDLVVSAKQIQVRLSQQETARFLGDVEVQANWILPSGDRVASQVATCTIDRQLLTVVIP